MTSHGTGNFTVAATASALEGAVTNVYFFANGALLGSDTTVPYSVQATNISPGAYSLTAVADDSNGRSATSAPVSINVFVDNIPPTVAMTSPLNGSAVEVLTGGTTNVTLTASASDFYGQITQVTFRQNGVSVGTVTNTPYTLDLTSLPAGVYAFDAIASNNFGLSGTSAPVIFTVFVDPGPPDVAITAPADSTVITAPSHIIGTASSIILQSYQVQYRLRAPDDSTPAPWLTLKTGTNSVVNDALATFDPTLLLNGIYEVQLTATDRKNRTSISEILVLSVEKNLKIGQFTLSFSDLRVPLVGIPIEISRTYDSRDQRTNDFGIGWSLGIKNVTLRKTRNLGANWSSDFDGLFYSLDSVQPRDITVTFSDTKVYHFESVITPEFQLAFPIESVLMTFTNMPGTYGSLGTDGDNESAPDGFLGFINLVNFEDFSYFNPTRFRFTNEVGEVYIIDEKEGIKSMSDRNGNTLTFTTNGIFHSSGVSVAFTRDDQGRITEITDPMSNKLHYVYGTNGSLSTFTDRVTNTTTFAYTNVAFPHYLTTITDPRGIQAIRTEYDDSGRMVRQIDPDGNAITFNHDFANNHEIITDRLNHSTVHYFDDRGNVVATIDALNNTTTFKYDDFDNLLEKVDALGNTNRYTYDGQGNKLTETDPLGNVTHYTYGQFRELTSTKNARGFTSTNRYDAETGNRVEMCDPLGFKTTFNYDGQGNLITLTDPLTNTVESKYDQFGHLTNSVTRDVRFGVLDPNFTYDDNGNQTSMSIVRTATSETGSGTPQVEITVCVYDDEGRPVRLIYPDGSSIETIFNSINKPAAVVDPLGRTNFFQYNEQGNLVRSDYADGTFQLFLYDAENRLIGIQDRAGRNTWRTNDALGRPITLVHPDGTTTHTDYDEIGRVIAETDERGYTTRFGYNPNCGCSGRKTAVTNALGEVTIYDFDQNGNVSSMRDALGRTNTYIYDANDRLESIILPDNSELRFVYDALDRQIAEIDQSTNVTWFDYDAGDRLVAVTNALNGTTTFDYDEVGNLLSFTDAEGRTTRYAYDNLGRYTSRTLPGGQIERYRYDAANNLTNRIDFNGHSTIYRYDIRNRLTQRIPDPVFGEPTVSFTYTATDQRATMVDASGTNSYFYNSRDWLTNKVTPQGTLDYEYDVSGNVTRIRSLNVNGVNLTYEYDPLNRVITVDDSRSGRSTNSYNPAGSLSHYRYPNGLSTTSEFNPLEWVTNQTTLTPQQTVLNSYLYALHPTGRRLSEIEPGRRTVTYGYDALYRLTGEINSGAGGSLAVNYAYDKVGNRLTRNSQAYSYDANDQLGGATYDANGNPLTGTVVNPTNGMPVTVADQYDSENQLINRNSGGVQVVYDGDGNRVRKTVNGITTHYLVDELNPSGYAQVVEELTEAGSQPAFVNRLYAYDYALISQDQLLDDGQGGFAWRKSFYGLDAQGNVRYLSDTNGIVTDTYDYDAFGNLIQQSGNTPNNYLYNGKQFDPDLGLYYLRARYLNTDKGRFWTRDRFGGYTDEPLSLNGYIYANADPVNNYDPSGYETLVEVEEAQAVDAELRFAEQSPRFAKAIGRFCNIVDDVSKAANAYQTAMQARNLAIAAGSAAGADGVAGVANLAADIYGDILIQTYDLKGLEQYDLYTAGINAEYGEDLYVRSRYQYGSSQTPCFSAGTLISTEHGPRPIETLQVGDKVWALGQGTAELALKPIKATFRSTVTNLVVLRLSGELLETTPGHPFWVRDEGWVNAGQLRSGDELFSRLGGWLSIDGVEYRTSAVAVFNFEVDGWHTYLVTEQEALVHNAPKRTYITYTAKDVSCGCKFYSGMSSGKSNLTPQQILNRRKNNHHRNLIDFVLDSVPPCYAAARGREYMNYEKFQQQGIGTTQNVPISSRNKNKAKYLKAAKDCNLCK